MNRMGDRDARSCFLLFVLLCGAVLITAGVLLSVAYQSGGGNFAAATQPEQNQERPAADFTLPDLNGNRVSLSQFRGQPLVINFWATWCPPCRSETPRLIEAYQREHGGVAFIAISDETADVVGPFVKANAVPYVVLLDSGDRVSSDYGVRALPTTFFVNRDGEIKVRYVGEMSANIIERALGRIK